eukprot:gene27176-32735_t
MQHGRCGCLRDHYRTAPDSDQGLPGSFSPDVAIESEVRANLAGEASADAALALHEAANPTEPETGEEPPAVPRDLTAAAFFDVDNTMVQGASIIHFARGLAARKYLKTSDLVDFAWKQIKFRVTGRESSDDVAEGREKALSFVAGRSTAELARLGEEIYDEVIAEKLGLTGALGTVAESEDGVFTGRLVGDILHGMGKAHAVRTLAVREGLNLKRCSAYSDSHNDVPMLSLVGTPVAINPDADLRELAKNR